MTRKPDEWMPLHIGDYHADTTHLTRDQHGAYFLLLMAYWRRGGPLPADDARLAAIVKATPAEWRRLKPTIMEFFAEQDGGWVQKRAEAELSKAKRLTEAKAEAGRKGAESKWQDRSKANDKRDGKTMAVPSICQWQTDAPLPLPSPTPPSNEGSSVEGKPSTGASASEDLPEGWPRRDSFGRPPKDVTDKTAYLVGKAVLGSSAGGLVTRMKTAYRGDWRAVVQLLLDAQDKADPKAWFNGALKRAELDEHIEPKHSIFPEHSYR